ncbi:bifunctional 3-oxoadipate enol-lactonase/4-carboxymuconolactone decarboxylase PcaDC [Streptodolium elevatio]|uniref:3-oxoadipate enol-lactonase n=1 Tax=Streptodolium elevatio TaxID=3157996 RepID=A0ABV3DGJ8_9ACTN
MTTPVPHHRVDGAGGPPLILGPSLGTTLHVWDPQVTVLARDFTVVRWDLPGHGGTPYQPGGEISAEPLTVAALAAGILALADTLGLDRFAYAGISLGGAVGAWLAAHHPERVTALAVVCSSARFGEPGPWHERAELVRAQGVGPVADGAAKRWFTADFADAPEARRLVDAMRGVDPHGYAACCDAIAGYDLRTELPRIAAPTLVVAGRDDPATPPAHARELADGIADSTLVEIAGSAHLANVEQPDRVLTALAEHLLGPSRARGTAVRREVLGDEHVDRAIAATTEFTAPFQDFITRYAWGEIWTRPGLDRRTRSCITLTALVAHGHHDELAMHVRAALRNGLTRDEIREVLLQTAVYCGVPAANSAFAVAARVLADIDSPTARATRSTAQEGTP